MSEYAVRLTNRFRRSFRRLPKDVRERVEEAVLEIAEHPYSGYLIMTMGVWSYRVGDYRIIYLIREEEREVVLLTVRHRRRAYR